MAFQEVTMQGVDLKKFPHRPMVGFYMGSHTRDGMYGTEEIHDFQLENGSLVHIYGFTTLNRKLGYVEVGTLCKVTYLGVAPVKTTRYGVTDVHQIEVLQDTERRLDTFELPAPKPQAKTEEVAAVTKGKKAPTAAPATPEEEDLPF